MLAYAHVDIADHLKLLTASRSNIIVEKMAKLVIIKGVHPSQSQLLTIG